MIKYPLASSSWDNSEIEAINNVVESDMYTMGKHVKDYESDFAKFFGSKYAVMVSSGSAANLLMIAALFFTKNETLNLKRGDEVIVPAVSWSTTYFPLYQYGLKLKFVDIDRDTLNIDLEKVGDAITENTRAIMCVNLLGNPIEYNKLRKIINNRNIVVIEDNCESMGSTLDGKYCGTFGVMGSFSSFFSHHISTMEGGCVVTEDEELYHIMLCMRAHGWTRNLPEENKLDYVKSDDPFDEAFKFILPGYNLRPLEMSGAIGIEQLKKLPSLLEHRQRNASYFKEVFSDHPYLSIQQETGKSSWFGFSLLIAEEQAVSRRTVVELLRSNGVECRPIVTGNFVRNPVIEYFDYEVDGELEAADFINDNGLFVGNHHYDIRDKIDFLKAILG